MKIVNDKVRVIRHLRLADTINKNRTSFGYNINSKGGITFVFDIFYKERLVDISFSICSPNDNFCKSDGIRYAKELGVERTFNLDAFQAYANDDDHAGFVRAYLSVLRANECIDINSSRESILISKIKTRKYIFNDE